MRECCQTCNSNIQGSIHCRPSNNNSNYPLQLWDRLTLQVKDTLNMLPGSCGDPSKSTYEVLNSPYNWNRYPLAPLGCKAIVYKDGDTHSSWASHSVNAFYLGPAKDHYRCYNHYVPETKAHRISGSTELFPQHCQLRSLMPHQHFRALTDELTNKTALANSTPKGRCLLQLLSTQIISIRYPPSVSHKQRVTAECQRQARKE